MARKELVEEASKAVDLLKGLTAPKKARHAELPLGTEGMPRNELMHCAGLAFTFTTKGGVIIAYEQGKGFVVSKLPPGEDGFPKWSAPLFFNSYGSSVGFTAGVSMVDSVIVLDTKEAVDAFRSKSQATLNADLNFSYAGKVGVNMPATALDMVHPKLTNKTFAYSSTKGMMIVDSSFKGLGYHVDEKLNAEVYGTASWSEILEGAVPPPEEFASLYETISFVLTAHTA